MQRNAVGYDKLFYFTFEKTNHLNFSDLLLVIVSSAGLLHGLAFAVYLFFFKKKKALSNYLLGLILVFMAFRIGKSVMLNFGDDLEPIFIFVGLSVMLIIGPLLRWYILAMTVPKFKLHKKHIAELIPFLFIFTMSISLHETSFDTLDKQTIVIFGTILIFIYIHFAMYIGISARVLIKAKAQMKDSLQTKSQKIILDWLQLVIIGFIIIWVSYFLNIIEDSVPYVVGPIVYSLVIYYLSYKAFDLKITDLDGEAFKINDKKMVYTEICAIIENEKLFIEPDVSLSGISKLIGKSPQYTSELINQYAQQNFNDFINHYRIQEAKKLLIDQKSKNHTISSIAFDTGFSSLSSFNSAFKKFESQTPSSYRKEHLI
jgi:AraC-like DNA-binding protein